MSAPSTVTEPVQVYYGVNEVADNPDISNFSFETVIPVVIFDGDRRAVRVRSTWIGLDEIRGHIAWLEERALQADADLRYANDKLDVEAVRLHVAERAAQDANEVLRSLRSDQFACNTVVPLGDVDGSGNVWVRLRSTEEGVGMLLKQLRRLDERAVLAEAALAAANECCRQLEKRVERADWTAGELRRDEFEWQDTIPVAEPGGERVVVRVLGTEVGIAKIKAFIARLEGRRDELYEAWVGADDRADAAEDKLEAIRVAAPAVADSHAKAITERDAANARADAAEVRLQVAESKLGAIEASVKGYTDFSKSVDRLEALGVRPVASPSIKVGASTSIFPKTRRVDPSSEAEAFRRAVRAGV